MYNMLFFLSFLVVFIMPNSSQDKELKSLKEDRIEVLKFGIDTEIIDVLNKMKEEKDFTLNSEINIVLENTTNPKLIKEIFDFFKLSKDQRAASKASQTLKNHLEVKPDVLISVLGYLSEHENDQVPGEIKGLLKNKNQLVVSSAIKFLSKKKNYDSYTTLIELYNDETTTMQIRSEIILAFGEQKEKKALPLLKQILSDEDEDITLRRYACHSLGKIGVQEALPEIKKSLESSDNILRSYAISALGNFPSNDTEKILLTALRDSFPRVRELAVEQIGVLKSQDAVDPLIFRAKKDPEKRVRHSSIKALANINSNKGNSYLLSLIEDEKALLEYRTFAIEKLIDINPSLAVGSLQKVMDQEWKKESSVLLDFIGKSTSQKECKDFESLFKRMLEHRSYIIQIYAIRGIQKNKISGLHDTIKEFTQEKYNPQLRKHALSVLENK